MKKRTFVFGLIGVIFLVIASGVFWSTNLPNIEIAGNEVKVVHCEPPLPKYAKGVCPKLYCKKAIIESGQFPAEAQIGFQKTDDKVYDNIYGAIRYQGQGNAVIVQPFQCVMDGYKVVQLLQSEQTR